MPYVTSPVAGVDFSEELSTQIFPLGFMVQDSAGGWWQYIKAATALTSGACYKILSNHNVGSATAADNTVDDDAANFVGGFPCGWPQMAFTINYYGWIQRSSGGGTMEIMIVTDAVAGSKMYTSATAGQLDDTLAAHYGVVGPVISVDAGAGTTPVTARVTQPAFVTTTVADAAA